MRPRAWRRRGDEGHVVAMRLRVEPEARLSVCFGCAVVLHTNVSRETFVRRCLAIRFSCSEVSVFGWPRFVCGCSGVRRYPSGT